MKFRLLVVPSFLVCAVVACSGGDFEVAAPEEGSDAGGAAAPVDVPATTPQADGGQPQAETDAGQITDGGGGDPDDEQDAGLVADAGPDGGTCGPASGNGPAVASNCSSGLVFNGGGVIATGTYDLQSFTVLGIAGYCATFKASSYEGRLDVSIAGKGKYLLAERVVKSGGLAFFPNKTFEATVAASTLNVTQLCGTASPSTSWGYSIGSSNGKATLTYTHATGSATVRYTWIAR